jgi:hypothetical protein
MGDLFLNGFLGAAIHYGLASHFTGLYEERAQTHVDVLVTGFAGGVFGGLALNRLFSSSPTFFQSTLAALGGVILFDYFLFNV